MAKKILGDDPFSQKTPDADKTPMVAKKTKRAPPRKTEAPRAARAKTAKPVTVAPAAAIASAVEVEPSPITDAVALTPPLPDPVPASGTWQGWRVRQQQLARAEDAAWLARADAAHGDRFGRDPALAGRAEPIVDLVYRSVLRVSARGLGHVPESGRAILVARRRHEESHGLAGLARAGLARLGFDLSAKDALDAAIVAHAIRTEHVAHREVRPLVRPARLYTPLFGRLLRRLGGVPADVHDLARLLDDDRLALAFVSDRGHDALDARTLVCLALVTGAPIVPVVIGGATLLGGRRTAIAFGMPLFPGTEFGPLGAEDEGLVARLAGELTQQLQPPR